MKFSLTSRIRRPGQCAMLCSSPIMGPAQMNCACGRDAYGQWFIDWTADP